MQNPVAAATTEALLTLLALSVCTSMKNSVPQNYKRNTSTNLPVQMHLNVIFEFYQ